MSGWGASIRMTFSGFSSETIRREVEQGSPEELLVRRVATGDREALAEIYARFQRPIFRYLFHLLGNKESAEDVLQQVMVIVWQSARTFQGTGQVAGWIFGIAHHQAFKALRRDASMSAAVSELDTAIELPGETMDPEADMLRRATHEEVARAMATLSAHHREVLELAFFHDFGCKEIAVIAGVPLGTVKSRLSYARRALKAALVLNGWEA